MVGEAGIEPTTPGLEGRCSIQLSYSPALDCFYLIVMALDPIVAPASRLNKELITPKTATRLHHRTTQISVHPNAPEQCSQTNPQLS